MADRGGSSVVLLETRRPDPTEPRLDMGGGAGATELPMLDMGGGAATGATTESRSPAGAGSRRFLLFVK